MCAAVRRLAISAVAVCCTAEICHTPCTCGRSHLRGSDRDCIFNTFVTADPPPEDNHKSRSRSPAISEPRDELELEYDVDDQEFFCLSELPASPTSNSEQKEDGTSNPQTGNGLNIAPTSGAQSASDPHGTGSPRSKSRSRVRSGSKSPSRRRSGSKSPSRRRSSGPVTDLRDKIIHRARTSVPSPGRENRRSQHSRSPNSSHRTRIEPPAASRFARHGRSPPRRVVSPYQSRRSRSPRSRRHSRSPRRDLRTSLNNLPGLGLTGSSSDAWNQSTDAFLQSLSSRKVFLPPKFCCGQNFLCLFVFLYLRGLKQSISEPKKACSHKCEHLKKNIYKHFNKN